MQGCSEGRRRVLGRLRRGPPAHRADLVALAGVLCVGFNLRIAVVAVGPVIDPISRELDLTSTEAGMLVTIPFLGMSAFSLVGPPLIRRVGASRTILGGMALLAVATALRPLMPTGPLVLLMTVPIAIGLGLAGVGLPVVVKQQFPRRPGRITGYYVASMALGAALVGYAIVPLSEILGGWRGAFAATAIVAAAALPFWLGAGKQPTQAAGPALNWPSFFQVRLGLCVAAVSMGFTGTITWAAAIYTDAGWSEGAAAGVTAGIMLFSIPTALIVPGLSDGHARGLWTAMCGAAMAVGLLGFGLAPTVLPIAWVLIFAFSNGAFFPLTLTLPLDHGLTAEAVAPTVAWSMAIGFLMGSMSPVLVGALRELTGSFAIPMVVLALASAAGGLLALGMARAPTAERGAGPASRD